MKRSTSILCAVTGVFLFVLVGVYVLGFLKIKDMEREVATLAGEIATKTSEYAHATETRSVLEEVVLQETEIDTHFVPTHSIVAFLESVEGLGTVFGTKVTVVSVSDPSTNGEIALALSVEGRFDAVMRTLGLLEHSQVASATKTLTLDTAGDGAWTAAITGVVLTPKTP